MVPMLERVRESCGELPAMLTADTGYLSDENLRYCEERGIDAYIALRSVDEVAQESAAKTARARRRYQMQIKLRSDLGRETYAKRKVLVEPVFGQIKAAMGFRRFSLRGLAKAASEWGFVCACHNLLKLFRRRLGPVLQAA